MRLELWIAICLSSRVLSDNKANTRDGESFSWGWQLSPGPNSDTVGQYYVRLPESKQHVNAADETGYHDTITVNTSDGHHTHPVNFALGDKTSQLISKQLPQHHQAISNETQEISNLPYVNVHPSMDIYLLPNQLPLSSEQPLQVQLQSLPNQQHEIFQIPDTSTLQYPYIAQLYNIQTQHPQQSQMKYDDDQTVNGDRFIYNTQSQQFRQRESTDDAKRDNSLPINQVFKNNCTDDNVGLEATSKEIYSDMQKSKQLFAEIPSYEIHNLDGDFGMRGTTNRPLSYRGAVHFRVETPRPHKRNERFYFTTAVTPISPRNTVNISQEGINRLVESTQDLISNEDLIKINHAVEKQLNDQSDDIIKPKPRFNYRVQQSRGKFLQENWRRNQNVKDKIKEIFGSDIKPVQNENWNKEILEANSNHYKFTSPIVVTDTFYDSKDQIFDNIVSTMIPYIENGYEIVSVKSSPESSNTTCRDDNSTKQIVNVTPRPLGQNYLVPITVGLRLLNANGTISSYEDFETSDSELVANTVANPKTEKTVVEIEESLPIEITHINDVEVHEYLEGGRSNDRDILYNKYVDALRSSKNIQDSMNKMLYKYGTMNNHENQGDQNYKQDYTESKENLESSENIQTEIEVKPESKDSHQRSEVVSYENNYGDQNAKIIQPIVIEKEVPVTKFVDRFVEKQVPYTERVEVPVPVDRPVPVAVPVERIVEKPVEVTRYIDKPFPVEVPRPYPVEVKVPYPVEQKVYVDRPVHVPYPVEKVVEKQVVQRVPIPTPVGIPYEVHVPVEHQVLYPIAIEKPVPVAVEIEKRIPVEKIVHREVRVPYPVPYETKVAVPYPVERRIPVPVEKIVEKPVTVTKIVEKPVHIQIPVPHPVAVPVHVPQPVPIDRIIEKRIPVPYPIEKVVERIVQKPVLVTKYVDKPYPVEKRVPYPVEKIVERKVPYPVQVPVEIKVPYPIEKIIEKHVPVPVYRYLEKEEESRANYRYQNSENSDQGHNFNSNYGKIIFNPNIQSTLWGNQNTSKSRYNNTQDKRDFKTNQSIKSYLNYLVNSQNSPYQYVPVPLQENNLAKNKNYLLELKLRRTDRVPRVTNLRIEYGGFKPPLVPSTEVDLDGLPVNKE